MTTPDDLFAALSDPTRRAIFERLCREGEKTVGALTAGAGVKQPVVSRHLSVLREAGLVQSRQDGRQNHYAARPRALAPLVDWTADMSRFWDGKLDKLEDLLRRMDK